MRNLSLPSGPLKVACLAAHPDDIEIAAGATLLALAERGKVEGHWLTLTSSPDRRAKTEEATALGPTCQTHSRASTPFQTDGCRRIGTRSKTSSTHSLAPYQTLTWSLHREWMTPIKITGCWARWHHGLARCPRPPLRDSEVGRRPGAIKLLRALSPELEAQGLAVE